MGAHTADGGPVIVALPAEVDVINAERVYDQLYVALISGSAIVIADFTATTFCDSAGMQRLVMIHNRAVAREVQFWLVVPPAGSVRRALKLIGLHQLLPVYSTVAEATSALTAPVPEPSSLFTVRRHERRGLTPYRCCRLDYVRCWPTAYLLGLGDLRGWPVWSPLSTMRADQVILSAEPPIWRQSRLADEGGALFSAEQGDRRGYDAHSCR